MNLWPKEQEQFNVPSWYNEAEGIRPEVSVLFSYGSIVLFLGAMLSFAYAQRGIETPVMSLVPSQTVDQAVKSEVPVDQLLESLTKKLVTKFSGSPYLHDFGVDFFNDHIIVRFSSHQLYHLGKAELLPRVQQEVYQLASVVKEGKGNLAVRVDTYTDDMPVVKNAWLYPTNWELSGARAASIIRVFEDVGMDSDKLEFSGHGQSRPKYPNNDGDGQPIMENRAKNRRVEIRIQKEFLY